ncbi:MAG: hypothetical protein AB7E27_04660 [Candidatus Methanomethylophilaceae archaeon]|jgi:hypothetical protein
MTVETVTPAMVARIERSADPLNCEEVADNVREGIRTVGELRRCGCPRCLGALQILGEAV